MSKDKTRIDYHRKASHWSKYVTPNTIGKIGVFTVHHFEYGTPLPDYSKFHKAFPNSQEAQDYIKEMTEKGNKEPLCTVQI